MFFFLTTATWKRDGTFRYGNLVDELADLEDTAIRNRDTDNNRGEEDEEDEIEEDEEEEEEEEEENEGSGENPNPKKTRPKGKRPRQRRHNKRPFIRRDGSKDDPHGLSNDMIYDRMIHNDRRVEDRFIDDESM